MVFRWIVQTAMPCAVDRHTDNVLHTPDSPSGNSNLLNTHETRSFCFLSKHYQLVFDLYVFLPCSVALSGTGMVNMLEKIGTRHVTPEIGHPINWMIDDY